MGLEQGGVQFLMRTVETNVRQPWSIGLEVFRVLPFGQFAIAHLVSPYI